MCIAITLGICTALGGGEVLDMALLKLSCFMGVSPAAASVRRSSDASGSEFECVLQPHGAFVQLGARDGRCFMYMGLAVRSSLDSIVGGAELRGGGLGGVWIQLF